MRHLVLNAVKVASAIAIVSAAGCGLSDVGKQDEPVPTAVVSAVGQDFTTDSSGKLSMTVRAGAEVVLTGRNSKKGTNDSGVPILRFDWSQSGVGDSDPNKVQLIQRTNNTVSFTAPQVTTDNTELVIGLKVTDAKGANASSEAHVIVRNIRDEDHFLQFLNSTESVSAVLTTTTPLAAGTGPYPVTITITKLVTFTDRNQPQGAAANRTRIAVGKKTVVTTSWAAGLGGSSSCSDKNNPAVDLPIPRLSLDDVLASSAVTALKGDFPNAVLLSDVLEPADIDGATLEMQIDLASTSSAVTDAAPAICVATGSTPATTATASGSVLAAAPLLNVASNAGLKDSHVSTTAYYKAVDPSNAKTTLDQWLDANGFKSTEPGTATVARWNADAHAVYTNKYDLGFGRDMYMKFGGNTGKCDDGAAPKPQDSAWVKTHKGTCDVAAVVVNYVGVEAAAKAINPIVAVAMDYSAVAGSNERFTKFYTYTQDTRSGEFRRVLSVDLDRRGQQFMPQSCVVCHGGTPSALAAGVYPNSGNVNAGFMLWDLASLLYSDTDLGFSNKSDDADLRAKYTLGAQQAQFKLLNTGAYLTMSDPVSSANRYALTRELVEKWYQGAGLPGTTYDDSKPTAGWDPGAEGNPADSGQLYLNVFARNCRACHVMQVPNGQDPRTATFTSAGAAAIPYCSKGNGTLNNRSAGATYQVPMGCYWEFVHAPNLADRVSANRMPFARRTSDRFWIDPVSSSDNKTAGKVLQDHLATAIDATVTTPGTPKLKFGPLPTNADIDSRVDLALDPIGSYFVDDYSWTVDGCSGTLAAPGTCSRALPVVGNLGARASFTVDQVATYKVSLAANAGATTSSSNLEIADKAPEVNTGLAVSFQVGSSGLIPSIVKTLGNGNAAEHRIILTLPAGISVTPVACGTSQGCPATSDSTIQVRSTAASATTDTLSAVLEDAGGVGLNHISAAQNIAVTINASFTAPSPTLQSVNANSAAADLPLLTVVGSVLPINVSGSITNVTYTGPAGQTPQYSLNSDGTLHYQPSLSFATHDKSGNQKAANNALQTFSYTLRRNDTNEVSDAIFTIPVKARVSIDDARATWTGSSCSSCHSGGAATGPRFGDSDINGPLVSYSDMKNGTLSQVSGYPYVYLQDVSTSGLSSVLASGLLCWPQTDSTTNLFANYCTLSGFSTALFHTGGHFDLSVLINVEKWIEDGANDF